MVTADEQGDPGGGGFPLAEGGDTAPAQWFRRPRVVVPVLVVAVALGAIGIRLLPDDPNRRIGPDPTVDGPDCGLSEAPASVLSLDGDTGALRWSRVVGGPDFPDPTGLAVADGTVAVLTGAGMIQGLAAADGAARWCADGGTVSAVDDRLFTVRGDAFVEVDPVTGVIEPVAADVLPKLLEAAAGPIAVRGEGVEMDFTRRTLTAKDRETGADLWSRDVPGHQFVTTDDLVLVNDQTNGAFTYPEYPDRTGQFSVTAYRLSTGDEAWSVQVPEYGWLFLAGDRAYVKGWHDGRVRAIDPETGRILWAVEHDHPGRTARFSERGELTAVAVDPASGDVFVLLVSEPPYRD